MAQLVGLPHSTCDAVPPLGSVSKVVLSRDRLGSSPSLSSGDGPLFDFDNLAVSGGGALPIIRLVADGDWLPTDPANGADGDLDLGREPMLPLGESLGRVPWPDRLPRGESHWRENDLVLSVPGPGLWGVSP